MSDIGFSVQPAPERLPEQLLNDFRGIATSHISDSMNRLSGINGLRPYHVKGNLVGCAFTVRTRPGDNLMIHHALDLAQKNDVIVIDGGGAMDNALLGEIMGLFAQSRGIAGFVVDGAIRDIAWFSDFPCFARGHTHRGPYKDGPGEINVPVVIGGQVVHPGDLIVGDEDGLLAIRPADAQTLLQRAQKKASTEEETIRMIREGRSNRAWVSEILREKGII